MNKNNSQNEIIKSLIHNLPPDISQSEADFLNSFPLDEVIRTLKEILFGSPKSMIRSRAFYGLMNLNDLDKVGFLIELYDNHEERWGNTCCKWLAEFNDDARAHDKLCQIAINSNDSDIRYNAVESLKILGNPQSLPILTHIINHDDGVDYEGRSIKVLAKKVAKELS